jgi:hypothetical protein
MTDFQFKLGRLSSPPEMLAKAPKLSAYLDDQLPSPPAIYQSVTNISDWGMLGNDQLGDCTAAGAGHLEMVWTDQVSGTPRTVTTDEVIKFYELQGYDPSDPSTDQGANMMDVLASWHSDGLAGDKIAAYARVALEDHTVEQAIALFGGAYIGVNLPNSAIQQFGNGQDWDVVDDDGGIAGGHCVVLVGYDESGATVVTWGRTVKASWDWLRKYTEEAWAVLPSEYEEGTVNGFNFSQLSGDLVLLSQES